MTMTVIKKNKRVLRSNQMIAVVVATAVAIGLNTIPHSLTVKKQRTKKKVQSKKVNTKPTAVVCVGVFCDFFFFF